ncbi:hypothetical protein, partial [Acidovorax sp. SD340]|uniref:hypothetical protein n=1 Tax=Acidovorax sp. SD340 TaxID=1690268 RepID=UPI001EE3EDD5
VGWGVLRIVIMNASVMQLIDFGKYMPDAYQDLHRARATRKQRQKGHAAVKSRVNHHSRAPRGPIALGRPRPSFA